MTARSSSSLTLEIHWRARSCPWDPRSALTLPSLHLLGGLCCVHWSTVDLRSRATFLGLSPQAGCYSGRRGPFWLFWVTVCSWKGRVRTSPVASDSLLLWPGFWASWSLIRVTTCPLGPCWSLFLVVWGVQTLGALGTQRSRTPEGGARAQGPGCRPSSGSRRRFPLSQAPEPP